MAVLVLPAQAVRAEDPSSLMIMAPQQSGLAVVRRGDGVIIALDGPQDAYVTAIAKGPQKKLLAGELKEIAGGWFMTLPLPADKGFGASRSEQGWTLMLDTSAPPEKPIEWTLENNDARKGLVLAARTGAFGAPLSIPDPLTGDRLLVIPSREAGAGGRDLRRMPDVEILPSSVGAIIHPLRDDVEAVSGEEGVEVFVLDGGGLRSGAMEGVDVPAGKLFDWPFWKALAGKNYLLERRRLMDEIVAAKPEKRKSLRLDMARFELAHGHAQEALGVLQLAATLDKDAGSAAEWIALRGVARAISGDAAGARADLGIPVLVRHAETLPWRGLAAAKTGKWDEAQEAFNSSAAAMSGMPEALGRRLVLARIESAVIAKEKEQASSLIANVLSNRENPAGLKAGAQFFEGKLFASGDSDIKALEIWQKLEKGRDPYWRVRSGLERIKLERARGDIREVDAAEQLARLGLAWRGDALEMEILSLRAELLEKAGDARGAMETLRAMVRAGGDTPAVEARKKRLSGLFLGAFNLAPEGAEGALASYALFKDFREFVPAGDAGRVVLEKLAVRLAVLDLLNEGVDIYEQMMQGLPEGAEKARLGTRMAGLQLLDGKPDASLATLDSTQSGAAPKDMADERRLMRAEALLQMGRTNEAAALLAGDGRLEAASLAAEIAWKMKDWKKAAEILGRLAGDPPDEGGETTPAQRKLVLRAAVALSLAEDPSAIETLRIGWGRFMKGTDEEALFTLLTSPDAPDDMGTLQEMAKPLEGTSMFRTFLEQQKSKEAPPPAQPMP